MKPEEITALAREYAEEIYPHEEGEDLGQMSFLRNNAIKHISSTLKMLLRRYCLVEKEAVRKEYESVKDTPEECNYEELGATWDEWPYLSRFYDEGYKLGQKDTIESLFPEIAKEARP